MRYDTWKVSSGFTLIEMVTVIIILGVLAVGISSFLQFGTRIYAEATLRDQIISSARFSIERLNRELRHATPNSIQVSGSCLSFTPIVTSSIYIDIPVSPEPSTNTFEVVPFDATNIVDATKVIVYPLGISDFDVSSNKNHAFTAVDQSVTPWIVNFSSGIQFELDSPTQKLFFIGGDVSYCVNSEKLIRNDGVNSVLMAEDISAHTFEVNEASLQRNAFVQVHFTFSKSNETITFTNEIQVPNVP